jgi:hypothetical protein
MAEGCGEVQLASAGVAERPLMLMSDDCLVQRIPDVVVVILDVAFEERPVGTDRLVHQLSLLIEVLLPGGRIKRRPEQVTHEGEWRIGHGDDDYEGR